MQGYASKRTADETGLQMLVASGDPSKRTADHVLFKNHLVEIYVMK